MSPSPAEEGSPSSKICYIGEAPGQTEMRRRKPFVGPSGNLLDNCSHSAGIVRKELYLLNVFEHPVKKTKSGDLIHQGEVLFNKNGPTPSGLELAKPFFERLSKCTSNVLVPLGGTALGFLQSDTRIMKWRGSILPAVGGRKMVPTIHPAASLRGQYIYRYYIVSDLKRAKDESSSPNISLPEREYILDPHYTEVLAYLDYVGTLKRFAIDIEVLNHQVSCLSIAPTAQEIICIPFVMEGGRARWSLEEEAEIWLHLAGLMGNPEIEKINQNILFDIHFLFQQMGIITRGPIGDCMVAHHILYPDFPKGLDFLCSVWTREPYYKDDGKMWKRPWADLEKFWIYNCKDSATAMEIWDALQPGLDQGYRETYLETVEMMDPLMFMMTKGFGIDLEKLAKTNADVKKILAEKEAELLDVAERPFNPGSPKQCMEYFYITKGIKPYLSRSTGKPTTDDKAMARIIRRYNLPEARLVQEIRNYRKLLGTYLGVGFDKDNRLRCSYNIRGTRTGRLSSSKTIFNTGLNMQNLDSRFKGFLVSD